MKDSLDRLLAAALRAPQKPPCTDPPWGQETRIIAAWRETLAQGESWWKLCGPFVATASLMIALSAALNFHALLNLSRQAREPAEFSMADSAIRLAWNP
ncbi:MAG: hypothetical protein P4L99_18290 [Chthoniobacter sp.]|nr:hypothetical protein [Chthoniobacter sp.]